MNWTTTRPTVPGWYWYKHRDSQKLDEGSNEPEPVRVTADGRLLFVGDWRGHESRDLPSGLFGDRIEIPKD